MTEFALPFPLRTRRGEVRRVGVELEFGGLSLEDAAEAVRDSFGGRIEQDHEHRRTVLTDLGEFSVTYDTSLLSDKKSDQLLEQYGLGERMKSVVGKVLDRLSGGMLPLEISSPPIPATQLNTLSGLEEALRRRHAAGTRCGLFTAFALHFNPEVVDPTDTPAITNTLRAFLQLYDWLYRKADVDTFRSLMPFISPFPEEYMRLVIDPEYQPDAERLKRDYLEWNPTRNRPLDLLPLLAFVDPDLTSQPELAGQKVKPRPTFHYRLPNSQIDEGQWSIAAEWERWVLVERLAAAPELMKRLGRCYLNWDHSVLGYLGDRWFRCLDEEWVPLLRELRPDEQAVVPGSTR